MENTITFDFFTYQRLKKSYSESVEKGQRTFFFDGHQFLTAYAKYMIDYLRPKFEN